MITREIKQIHPLKELSVLTRRSFLMLVYDRRGLLLSLLFPVAAAIVTVSIAGKDMFVNYEGTKSACFVFCCAAIWGGLFNSIQSIARERENVRRDFAAGLRLGCYILSKAIIQAFLCVVQSALLTCGILCVHLVYGNELPTDGLLFPNIIDYYVSLFLIMLAADSMGLFISCFVRKPETANIVAPYILILQLIFSGILFKMEGASQVLSFLMLSRWGMEALGSISDLNGLPLELHQLFPMIPHDADNMFIHSAQHLTATWVILLVFSIGFIFLGRFVLRRIAKDSR